MRERERGRYEREETIGDIFKYIYKEREGCRVQTNAQSTRGCFWLLKKIGVKF